MKAIRFVALVALLLAGNAAHGGPATPADKVATASAVGATGESKVKCTRERALGSNRIKRICLTDEQAKRLSAEERSDLIRADRSAAQLLGDR